MAKTFYFKSALIEGLKYEEIVIETLIGIATKSNTKDYDANLTAIPIPIEIKSDFWLHKTNNLCIERFSNNRTESPGGPWQSISKAPQGTLYVIAEWAERKPTSSSLKKLYVFNSHALVSYCQNNKPKRTVTCFNKNGKSEYITENWLYPVEELLPLAIEVIEVGSAPTKPSKWTAVKDE